MECIILCGGAGTRLKGVIGATPKCLALINNTPFLGYLFAYLYQQGCNRIILSLGVGSDQVVNWVKQRSWPFEIVFQIEKTPLGTGGAIHYALQKAIAENVLVINGDTLLELDLKSLTLFHAQKQAKTSIALNLQQHFDRYGCVLTNSNEQITAFKEKAYYDKGWINAGVYCISKADFLPLFKGETNFSFEKDYLEKYIEQGSIYGIQTQGYFIDIGVPKDFEQAQIDFQHRKAL